MVTTRAALQAVPAGKGRHGLKVERYFTSEGTHPYDELEWELRDAVITDWRTGEPSFEQRGVEFPSTWSMNATTIVAQKYFRGTLGTPQRERSVKHMIDRVADTIAGWGRKDGYFADEASAEAFNAELKHLLVHQKAAFNSPVWFNVGVEETPQCSACQPWDALVSTPEGLVPIGELVEQDAVGTKVYDAHGVTKVVATKHNGRKQVLRVHLKSGAYLDVTPDHLVWRVSDSTGRGRFVEAGDLRPGDRLEWHRTYAHGAGEITETAIAEAALAGWLQSDGFVGQYEGTNRSLTIEAMTINDAERDWVCGAMDVVLPGMHRKERSVETKNAALDCRRIRIYGNALGDFVTRWDLRARGLDMTVSPQLNTAPLPVVAAYLRSLFQAEGYVQVRERSARIALDMISEDLVRGVQALLARFGIFARVSFKKDARPDRHGCWSLSISNLGDRLAFRDEIGFLDASKAAKLEASLELEGKHTAGTKHLTVDRIEDRGVMDVYDIQTESGEYLSGNLRVHNCFILSVEDTMGSILNWYVEEGTIFKGGSGSGVNLSKIRSSKERLSGGGEPSGPVSFMRGADASAGTIRSGGKTRRAAKMVILDVDHPDIEEFIWCKAREEAKVKALREAGFDMDLDGPDYASIQYQNANNSVRVTDAFMRAVEAGRDHDLVGVTDGEVKKTVKARDLMRQIAEATWECADPGMQYDTTINDWHTTPNAGRINGSNPCSEYMHLDNSACNLASLNLRKFEQGGVFDVEAFRRAVEIIFTAQEIIVGNSSYPTEKIGENARAYRQLGLGYANLGGLLMSQGLAYDSDEGRAWAGAITALMTGHAYRTSAELARVQGPFDGYAADRDGMLRVIAKHKDAAEEIDAELAPANILEAAKRSWSEALSLGTEHGIRNAQASVLAPTGCLVGGTLVPTERGLVRLGSLGDPAGEQWQDLDVDVATDEGPRQATKFYVNGLESVVTVDTARGYRIQGTSKHRIKVVQSDGSWVWRRFGDIAEGDTVPLALDQLIGEPQDVTLPPLCEGSGRGRVEGSPAGGDSGWTGERHATAPRRMTPELAEFVGYFMGEGSLHARGIRLCIDSKDFEVVERLRHLGKELFNLDAHVSEQTGYTEVAFHSVRLTEWWHAVGFAKHEPRAGHAGKGWEPHIPDSVLHSNDRAVYAAFLRGLFEADGTVTAGYSHWSTTSRSFSQDVQALLLALGYPTTRTANGNQLRLQVDVAVSGRWADEVGFIAHRKQTAFAGPASSQRRSGERFLMDTVTAAELDDDELTYDLSVPDNVTYVANGFVSHNTIGLMMDCDTTGVEPDLGLVKMKKMVGGGSMRIVNRTVPAALEKLGYQPEQIEAIVNYIDEHSTIEGAPSFRDEHLPVFDCAMGERSIAPMGHVRMMAAVQPWISGAISKCVVGETLITTENGLVRIGSLRQDEAPDTFREEVLGVASLGGAAKTDAFYYGGRRKVRKAVLRSGHTITGTENHRVLVAANGDLDWRYLDQLKPGDYVAVQYGSDMWAQVPPRFDDFEPSKRYGSQKHVRIPTEMTEELAFLLGAYAAEGHTTRSIWTVRITNACEPVLTRVADAWRTVFDVEPVIHRPAERCADVAVASKTIVEFLDYLGCVDRASTKRIPDAILQSPRPMVLAFLQGLFLDAYASVTRMPKLALCLDSPQLLDDYQALLTNLGIVHGRISKKNAIYHKSYDEVYAVGRHAARLAELVPFLEPEKAARAARISKKATVHNTADVVPGLRGKDLIEMIPRGRRGQRIRSEFNFLHDHRTRHVSRHTLERVAAIPGVVLPEWLQPVLNDNLHFSQVESTEDAGEREVYDVSVPTTHAFVGNGVVNHNTVNLPESASIEDVEEMYLEGWKLGLKAIAIYRDNCKAAQPLSIAKKKQAEPAATAEQAQIVRRRLPKQRPSQTLSFQVGDAEGYLTAGEYPGDGLGEIFVKLGKQGSTLSGVMDAFAISVSLGLQYGVPLEAYVSKFTNMRFDPSGMTDDPEVKFASSIVDYMFRRLAIEYLPAEKRHELGIYTLEERNAQLDAAYGAPAPAVDDAPEHGDEPVADAEGQTVLPIEKPRPINDVYGDAPMCYSCGVQMVRSGSCHVCQSCGTTSGCS